MNATQVATSVRGQLPKEWEYGSEFFKIISSTDKSITPNSWIPDSFVIDYVKAYNEGRPITDVGLDMEEVTANVFPSNPSRWNKIKTRADGSVILHQEKTHTIDEHKKLVDCIHNLMAVLDTPIGRRQIKGDFADEAREIARKILQENNISIYNL
jgi:hypothetical protein